MKIHITGGKGFLGRQIREGLDKKHEVSVSDVDSADVLNLDALLSLFQREAPDLVIHLAGLMGAQTSKKRLYDYFRVNAIGTLNVLEAMVRCNVKRFLFLSSLTVHGRNFEESSPNKESDAYVPQHPYATSKVLSEYLVKDYVRFCGIRALILRPTIIVGNLEGEGNALNEFVRNAVEGRTSVIYGTGRHEREWISVRDLVGAVAQSVDFLSPSTESLCEELIISSGKPISMKRLAERCVELLGGGRVEFVDKNTQAFSLTSLSQKAKTLLQWEAADSIDRMINEIGGKIKEKGERL